MRLLLAVFLILTASGAMSKDNPELIIDAHAHLRLGDKDWIRPEQPVGTAELRKLDRQAGISRSALIVIGFGDDATVRAKNDAVIAAAAADTEHFYAVASVNPDTVEGALNELDRVAKAGVRMIKLHPVSQEFDVASPGISSISHRCGELGMTILFDSFDPSDSAQVGKFVKLALGQPKTRFILAHMGFVRFREMLTFAELRKAGAANNVWFDLSAIGPAYVGSPVQAELVWTMRQIGMDRMIFGSDWPVHGPSESLAAIRKMGLTQRERRLVLHDNIAGLIGQR